MWRLVENQRAMSTKKITYVVKEEKDSFEIRMDRENEISTVNDLDRGKG